MNIIKCTLVKLVFFVLVNNWLKGDKQYIV